MPALSCLSFNCLHLSRLFVCLFACSSGLSAWQVMTFARKVVRRALKQITATKYEACFGGLMLAVGAILKSCFRT